MLQGKRVVDHQNFGEGPQEDHTETGDDHHGYRYEDGQHGIEDFAGYGPFFPMLRLAPDGGIGFALQNKFVNDKHEHAWENQKNTEDRRHFKVVFPDPVQIGVSC